MQQVPDSKNIVSRKSIRHFSRKVEGSLRRKMNKFDWTRSPHNTQKRKLDGMQIFKIYTERLGSNITGSKPSHATRVRNNLKTNFMK